MCVQDAILYKYIILMADWILIVHIILSLT